MPLIVALIVPRSPDRSPLFQLQDVITNQPHTLLVAQCDGQYSDVPRAPQAERGAAAVVVLPFSLLEDEALGGR